MSIDTALETLLTFEDSRTAFPGDRRLSLATLHRWRLNGVRGVKLETILIGGLRYTSKEAIERFIQAQNADDAPASPVVTASQCTSRFHDPDGNGAIGLLANAMSVSRREVMSLTVFPVSESAQRTNRSVRSIRQSVHVSDDWSCQRGALRQVAGSPRANDSTVSTGVGNLQTLLRPDMVAGPSTRATREDQAPAQSTEHKDRCVGFPV